LGALLVRVSLRRGVFLPLRFLYSIFKDHYTTGFTDIRFTDMKEPSYGLG